MLEARLRRDSKGVGGYRPGDANASSSAARVAVGLTGLGMRRSVPGNDQRVTVKDRGKIVLVSPVDCPDVRDAARSRGRLDAAISPTGDEQHRLTARRTLAQARSRGASSAAGDHLTGNDHIGRNCACR